MTFFFFFFFQAEDGIRDLTVTGVQTCALPICGDSVHTIIYKHIYEEPPLASTKRPGIPASLTMAISRALVKEPDQRFPTRSEEHTSELQSQSNLVCRLLLEKKKKKYFTHTDAHYYRAKRR